VPRDYYEILGVSVTCTDDEIRRSYRRLARRYHPDVCKEPDAEERFKEIGQAYAVLSDSGKRERYDRYGHEGLNGGAANGGMGDFFDIFNQVFGGGFGQGFGFQEQARGADIEYEVMIDLGGVVSGWESELEVTRQAECDRCGGNGSEPGHDPTVCASCGGTGYRTVQRQTILGVMSSSAPCSECRGRGMIITEACTECNGAGVVEATHNVHVQVPPGIMSGQRIRHPGQGDVPAGGGIPGDLYVRVLVQSDERFERRDRELFMPLNISVAQATLGDTVMVPTIEGEAELAIHAGTQTGDTVRLRGQGLPPLHGGGRGDQIVVMRVVTPTSLTDRQRELLLEFAEEGGEEITPRPKGIRDRIREVFTGEG